jgi:ribonuclease D
LAKKEKGEKSSKPNSGKNLSELCKDLLGKQLDKAEQDSVWDRRPLRQSQLQYAALDAYCLIELFEKCKESAKKFNIDACEIAKNCKCQSIALPLFVIDT